MEEKRNCGNCSEQEKCSYSRNRYSRENRNSYRDGYSRAGDMAEQLRQMMDEAPDEMTRMEIKKLMDKMDNQR